MRTLGGAEGEEAAGGSLKSPRGAPAGSSPAGGSAERTCPGSRAREVRDCLSSPLRAFPSGHERLYGDNKQAPTSHGRNARPASVLRLLPAPSGWRGRLSTRPLRTQAGGVSALFTAASLPGLQPSLGLRFPGTPPLPQRWVWPRTCPPRPLVSAGARTCRAL
ncbi:unnamed protein product [Nyctereutes procyonoides]|uniref:(raccoon dog) hypothetical protein n=1 Tax=Nyctereutes procyonoides TaxID=34880 RepID=A0A811ZDE2_NYCPR|nr:unnamed protein product [Nyctereutes procyonoides]